MARPRLPPIDRILTDPKGYTEDLLKLPWPMLQQSIEQLKQLDQALGATRNFPRTPVELAITHTKWKGMDARHLHFIGEEVAEAIQNCGRVILSVPPQHMKSWTCGGWTPFWALVRNPECQILYISYEKSMARRWGARCRDLILQYGEAFGLKLDPKRMASDDWALTSGGGMTCVGVGGPVSGKTVHLLIVDDAIKDAAAARSDVQRENLWTWWDETASQRIQNDTAVIVIGTRWHEDDLIGRILRHAALGEGEVYENIILPAEAEEGDLLGRSPGEWLWPERKSEEFYAKKKRTLSPYAWAGSWQQRPSPPGGNMVDPEWWRYYRLHELPSVFDQQVQSWDLALDAEKGRDSYHCGLVLARKGALVYVLDAFHEHCDINKVISRIRRWAHEFPRARTKLVERSLAGPALAQSLRGQVSGLIPYPPKGKQKGSKEACLDACVPDIHSGNVLLPRSAEDVSPRWVTEFVEELRSFPRATTGDDYCDAFSQGMIFMLPQVRSAMDEVHAQALGDRPLMESEAVQNELLSKTMAKLAKPKMDALKKMAEQDRIGGTLLPFARALPSGLGVARTARAGRKMW